MIFKQPNLIELLFKSVIYIGSFFGFFPFYNALFTHAQSTWQREFCLPSIEVDTSLAISSSSCFKSASFLSTGELTGIFHQFDNIRNIGQHQFFVLNGSTGESILKKSDLIPKNAVMNAYTTDKVGHLWISYTLQNKEGFESIIVSYDNKLREYRKLKLKNTIVNGLATDNANNLYISLNIRGDVMISDRFYKQNTPKGSVIVKMNPEEFRVLRMVEFVSHVEKVDFCGFLFRADNSFMYYQQHLRDGKEYEFHVVSFDQNGGLLFHETLIDYVSLGSIHNKFRFEMRNCYEIESNRNYVFSLKMNEIDFKKLFPNEKYQADSIEVEEGVFQRYEKIVRFELTNNLKNKSTSIEEVLIDPKTQNIFTIEKSYLSKSRGLFKGMMLPIEENSTENCIRIWKE